jgi:uncharacterized membrane protein YjgN (DUF898 family)
MSNEFNPTNEAAVVRVDEPGEVSPGPVEAVSAPADRGREPASDEHGFAPTSSEPGAAPGQPASAPADAAAAELPPLPFSFTGNAAAYFRIWIVNLLLVLLTLGIWSAWAKVRKRRYFYGHTWVAGANFEYHGNPFAILRGRLLAAAAFAVYWFADHLQPDLGPWLLLALLAAAPWIVARSLAFNAANSSHRGIRFAFKGATREVAGAIWPLFLWPLVLWFTRTDPYDLSARRIGYFIAAGFVYFVLICAYPYAVARVRRLTVARSSWGASGFWSALRIRQVYAIYGIAVLLALGGLLVAGTIGFGIGAAVTFIVGERAGPFMALFAGVWIALLYGAIVVVTMAYTRSRIGNLVFATTSLERMVRFRSSVSARRLARLYAGNLLAILCSVGLLIPWAVVRVARYRVESLVALPRAPLDDVEAAVWSNTAATGEELGEVFGFDLAL